MENIKQLVLENGADLFGVADIQYLFDDNPGRDPRNILPGARSILVIAAKYLSGSMKANSSRLAINECRYIDNDLGRIARLVGRSLEKKGYQSVIIPSYYPLEITKETKGLIGDISLKRAGVIAGMGQIGINGLLVTPQFGPRVRLVGVLSDFPPIPTKNHSKSEIAEYCKDCHLCVNKCPAKAISIDGSIDIKACIQHVGYPYGLSPLIKFIISALDKPKEQLKVVINSPELWNYYQYFMVGTYFNCHTCQSACPVGNSD